MSAPEKFTVVGAGLGGALFAALLAESGRQVEVFEMRPDPRGAGGGGGRSINLAISTRGLHALEQAGIGEEVRAMAVPMRGRMIHSRRGRRTFQRYGTAPDHYLNSVSRDGLSALLLSRAARQPGVRLQFRRKLVAADLEAGRLTFEDLESRRTEGVEAGTIVGADGAFSVLRRRMSRMDLFDCEQSFLSHGYKELTLPARPGGGFAMETEALHIWPRGGFMMIALPNRDGSFTCTLFWPLAGPGRFEGLDGDRAVVDLFRREFPDALALLPDLAGEFFRNPTGSLVTIRCRPWHAGDRAVLLGDACHAVVPFFGQGANAAFEDAVVLRECLDRSPADRGRAFAEYEARRREHTDVLANLSIANFREMRDHTRSRRFRMRKAFERGLHRLVPFAFVPLYTLVTFTRMPYADAVRRARKQEFVLQILGFGLLLGISALLLVWILRSA